PRMFLTPDPFGWTRSSYRMMQAVSGQADVHLAAFGNAGKEDSDLIVTSPRGGYIAAGYMVRTVERGGDEINQWQIDPFEFFRLAFGTDDLPKPDTTTIAGRRIYYSHIDGDGWNNFTQLEEYRRQPVLSARVVMDKAIKPY